MKLHGNARTCPHSRLLIVERVLRDGWTLAAAGAAAGVSERTAAKWLARYRGGGVEALADRSSAPLRVPRRTPAERVRMIELLRRLRLTAAEIAECLGMAVSTVSAVLRRIGLGRRSRLEPLEPPNRYQHADAGALLHLDVKKLVRIGRAGHRVTGQRRGMVKGIGWDYVHVCVDDATRLAFAEIAADERGAGAACFLRRVVSELAALGVSVERVLTDNGACYRSQAFAAACHELRIRHLRTRPYRPRTNGKAERFIRTLVERWAYEPVYGSSAERAAALPAWLDFYNLRRPHASLGHQPPAARLAALMAEQRV
jgi:transposase InsO family protein